MARICYSCCGEGRGHSSRTLTLVNGLRRRGHQVRVYASHAAYAALSPVLENVSEIPGLVLKYGDNRVKVRKTISANIKTWRTRERAVTRLQSEILSFKPDLAITDFEPFLPQAAIRFGVPFVSVDHQHVIPGLGLCPPIKYWTQYLTTLAVIRWTHSGEIANLVTSFFQPKRPKAKGYHYFGPILREAIRARPPSNDGHVLVYQTSASFTALPEILKKVRAEFRIYAFPREGIEGNCTFKPRNHPDFLQDLVTCSWVLTNGGYTLMSEALALGKPVLSVPVAGQFEQWVNSYYLEQLGYGARCENSSLNAQVIEDFIVNAERYREGLQCRDKFDGTDAVLAKILSFL